MYAEFFGLAEMPFRITPDPRFLWYSDQHREAKAKILHHIQTRKGPVYLFADVGTGKTSIAKRIREEVGEDRTKRIVSAFAPNLKTSNAFLRFVMEEFGVKTDRNYAVSLRHFEQFLIDQFKEGSSPVLLIDEAQNLTSDMLKLIHHLFNFSTNTDFLIQVVLFGQLELHDRIHKHQSLRSRMTPARLNPFILEETKQMVEFRWQVAGGLPPAAGGLPPAVGIRSTPFDEEAYVELFRVTGGNPRDIVKLCDAALLRAFADGRKRIDKDTMLAAASDAFVIESTV
jgi:general secretion pathway protein A